MNRHQTERRRAYLQRQQLLETKKQMDRHPVVRRRAYLHIETAPGD